MQNAKLAISNAKREVQDKRQFLGFSLLGDLPAGQA